MIACRNWAAQVDLSVHINTCLGLSEGRSWKQRESQVDHRGVHRIDGIAQIDDQVLAHIERPRLAHQTLCEVFPNPPVQLFGGFGNSLVRYRLGATNVIKCLGTSVGTGGDVAHSIS